MSTIAQRLGPAGARNVRQQVARTKTGVQLYGAFELEAVEDDRIMIAGTACGAAMMRPPRRLRIDPNAFKKASREYLKNNPILLYHHDWLRPLGQVTSVEVRDTGPYIEAFIVANKDEQGFPIPSSTYIDEARMLVRNGVLRTFSVTVFPLKVKTEKVTDPRVAEGEFEVDVFQEVDWLETTVCSIPGSREATFKPSRLFANPFGDDPLPEEFERAYIGDAQVDDDDNPKPEVTTDVKPDQDIGQGERYSLRGLNVPKIESRYKLVTLEPGEQKQCPS